jgi:hypothetical protein
MTEPNLYATNRSNERRGLFLDLVDREAVRKIWHEAKQEARDSGFRGWIGPVFDLMTGRRVWIRPAPCGGGCYCDANYRTTTPRIDDRFATFAPAVADKEKE